MNLGISVSYSILHHRRGRISWCASVWVSQHDEGRNILIKWLYQFCRFAIKSHDSWIYRIVCFQWHITLISACAISWELVMPRWLRFGRDVQRRVPRHIIASSPPREKLTPAIMHAELFVPFSHICSPAVRGLRMFFQMGSVILSFPHTHAMPSDKLCGHLRIINIYNKNSVEICLYVITEVWWDILKQNRMQIFSFAASLII